MKKRIIISVGILFAITSLLLLVTIFQLYKEAEKVQRSIFVSEVLTAGDHVINKIDAILKNDTITFPIAEPTPKSDDSSAVVYQKFAKKFILDSISSQPIGLVKSTINYNVNNVVIIEYDTIYFDTNYHSLFPFAYSSWDDNMGDKSKKKHVRKKDIDLIEMDSNTIQLLNPDFLYRIIKENLITENITADFDYALFNAYTKDFVVPPTNTSPDEIINSEYVFSLKQSDKFIAPHYLILYFPTERGIFFQRMSAIVFLIILLLVIIFFIAFITLHSLYRQKKIAEVKNDFINNMTHEFKTPISTISLACEAITDDTVMNDNNLKNAYVSIIKDENERLKKMVGNILQLALLKKGQLRMNIEMIDVHELINKIVESISLQVSSNKGTLTVSLNAEKHIIPGDRTHIENVIANLIENAVKYSPQTPTISITTSNDKKYFVFSIKDHGIGISKKNQKKIFQEFYRVSKGNIHDTKGYGMGLGYVKKVVSLHDGYIQVNSELNVGSTFTVYLPI